MKLFSMICASALLAVAVTTSCTKEPAQVKVDTPVNHFDKNGKGFIKMSIAMPADRGTKADTYDDGLTGEYVVNDATLLLFSGTGDDESAYTLRSSYDITNLFDKSNHDQITSVSSIVKEISQIGIQDGDNVKAFVVLNKNGLFTVDGTDLKAATVLNDYANGNFTEVSGQTSLTGRTFADFLKLTLKGQEYSSNQKFSFLNNGFLMMNSPLSNQGRGNVAANVKVTTLATVPEGAIYDTETEAKAGSDAVSIYVERAVAKVTLTDATTTGDRNVPGTDPQITYELKSWILDVTTKDSYLTRNLGAHEWLAYNSHKTGAYQRFVDQNPLANEAYRINWAIDPTYTVAENNSSTLSNHYNNLDGTASVSGSLAAPQYCFENTFEVGRMRDNQSTRAIIAVQLKKNGANMGDFYTSSDTDQTVYDDEDTFKGHIKDMVMKTGAVQNFIDTYATAHKENVNKNNLIQAVTLNHDAKSGLVTVAFTLVSTLPTTDGIAWKDGAEAEVATVQTNASEFINKYKFRKFIGGVAYYPVVIRHFDEMETPWKDGEYSDDYNTTYPGDGMVPAENYLGRYGVVRNNWYEISVSSILGLGEAGIPSVNQPKPNSPNGTDDSEENDKLEKYIKVKINILSWRKRTQNTSLK